MRHFHRSIQPRSAWSYAGAIGMGMLLASMTQVAWSSCKLDATPLMYERKCEEFVKVDKNLNEHYARLMKMLPAEPKVQLRNVQRTWIEWRDAKCEELESGCVTGSCAGVAHDSCIVDLTSKRGNELKAYSKNLRAAEQADFTYLTDYPTKVPFSSGDKK